MPIKLLCMKVKENMVDASLELCFNTAKNAGRNSKGGGQPEMKRKSISVLIVTILALAAIMAVSVGGCTGEVGLPGASSSPSLSNAKTCKSVDPQTGEPIEATNTFTNDIPEIFCSARLSNAPSGTEIKSEWIYVQEDLLIDTWSTSAEGTRYLSSSITRPDSSWPTGDYKVILYLDGKEVASVSFKIQ
jgi:hypothetical protein